MVEAKKREYHPLLRGGRRREGDYTHGFSPSEMQSLSSMCEALLPCVDPEEIHGREEGEEEPPSKSLRSFYLTPGSHPPVPDEIAELMTKRGKPEVISLVRWVLWGLSTRLGTLLLCGFLSLSWSFPFIHRFHEMTVQKRESVLQNWTREKFFYPLRVVFFMVKLLCCFVFFSWTDEDLTNSTWEGVGYRRPATAAEEEEKDAPRESEAERPLDEGITETKDHTNSSLLKSLSEKGLRVSEDSEVIRVECDAVVVGSGCGGGVAAAVLAGAGHRVLVLEKGNYFFGRDYSLLEAPSMDQLYESGGVLGSEDGKMMFLAGSVVGGGSAVNWSACIKTPETLLREWAEEHKILLFRSYNYVAAMEAVWKRIEVTEGCQEEGFSNRILRRGCLNLGLEVNRVARNCSENHYCGHCGFGCRSGDKRGTDTTWLVDAVQHKAVILTGCKAEALLLLKTEKNGGKENEKKKGKKCAGVIARTVAGCGGNVTKRIEIRAKVTVLACGSLLTPPLMLSSGLKNKQIGKNLHLHPSVMAWGYFPDSSSTSFDDGEDLKGKAIYEGGIITSIHKVMDSSDHTDPKNPTCRAIIETPMISPGIHAAVVPWVSGRDFKQRMAKYSRTATLFTLVKDKGSGTIDSKGRIHYYFDPSDEEKLRDGLRRTLRILIAAGAVEVGTYRSDGQMMKCDGKADDVEEFLGGVDVLSGPMSKRQAWSTYTCAHQMGSCKIGATEEDGAVDENGESWEAQALFVCDASVLPSAVGVNPMITIQATAYCIAAKIAASSYLKKCE